MRTSNVGNWVIGVNPEYVAKFGEDGKKDCSSDCVPLDEDDDKTVDEVSNTEDDNKETSEKLENENCTVASKENEILKDNLISATLNIDQNACTGNDKLEENPTIDCDKLQTTEQSAAGNVDDFNQDTDEKDPKKQKVCAEEASSNLDQKTSEESVNKDDARDLTCNSSKTSEVSSPSVMACDQSKKLRPLPERLGLDRKKMTVDRYCSGCKNQYADPETKELIIYLHAVKYKVSIS